ncbi:MAG: hypothetical protein ATN32_03125 [Candidatus Epulonipiscium fishelsonii]|nr:MAG: hypothetical protein ATN32_03125 [Epulopiscium sp. AS2M-Bin002]
MLKKQLIKSYLNIKVIEDSQGMLKIGSAKLKEVTDEFKPMEKELIPLFKLLAGITDVEINYVEGSITIFYINPPLDKDQILKWIDIIMEVLATDMNKIKENWETDLDGVISDTRKKLIAKLK